MKIGWWIVKVEVRRVGPVPKEVECEIDRLLWQGRKIWAMRLYRHMVRNDFHAAKAYVEMREKRNE